MQNMAWSKESSISWVANFKGVIKLQHASCQMGGRKVAGRPIRKILLVSVKSSCPQIWGRKWLRQFFGRLEFLRSFCRKTSMSIKFLVFLGGKCRFYFYGRGDYSESNYFFLQENERDREVTGRKLSTPVFHGTLFPMDFWIPPRFLR